MAMNESESGFVRVLREEDEREQSQRRRKWDARWMKLAGMIGSWSKDPGHKVGCVLVYPRRNILVSSGYNGFPRALRDERLDERDYKLSYTVHAEVNAIYNALNNSTLSGSELTLYVQGLPPCLDCAKHIAQCGFISRVVTDCDVETMRGAWAASCSDAAILLTKAGVEYTLAGL